MNRRTFLRSLACAALTSCARIWPATAEVAVKTYGTPPSEALRSDVMTLLDYAKQLDPEGSASKIADLMCAPFEFFGTDPMADVEWKPHTGPYRYEPKTRMPPC
jgi:hypothetical protein